MEVTNIPTRTRRRKMLVAVGGMVTIMVRFVDFDVCLPYVCTTVHTTVIILLLSDSTSRFLSGNLSEHKHAHGHEHKHGV
jgi:hypothetical protein